MIKTFQNGCAALPYRIESTLLNSGHHQTSNLMSPTSQQNIICDQSELFTNFHIHSAMLPLSIVPVCQTCPTHLECLSLLTYFPKSPFAFLLWVLTIHKDCCFMTFFFLKGLSKNKREFTYVQLHKTFYLTITIWIPQSKAYVPEIQCEIFLFVLYLETSLFHYLGIIVNHCSSSLLINCFHLC